MPDPVDLAALRALHERSTPSPWTAKMWMENHPWGLIHKIGTATLDTTAPLA